MIPPELVSAILHLLVGFSSRVNGAESSSTYRYGVNSFVEIARARNVCDWHATHSMIQAKDSANMTSSFAAVIGSGGLFREIFIWGESRMEPRGLSTSW